MSDEWCCLKEAKVSAAGADWALAMGWVRLCAVMGLVERC